VTELPVLTSPLLDLAGVRHAFFTRQGGVSEGIYASLNVGKGSADDPEAVLENRRRAAAWFGLPEGALNTCYQVHSAVAVEASEPWNGIRPEADGVVTRRQGIACGALAADCAPILFADPKAGVVAAAHAGWKGALAGVAEATVRKMEEAGAKPAHIIAVVGPCIGPDSYEVGPEFRERFLADDLGAARFFHQDEGADRPRFDLPAFVLDRLRHAGVEACEWIGRDTCAEADLFFSNRRAFKRGEPDFGRLLSAIALV
jgi:YfiH family protein